MGRIILTLICRTRSCFVAIRHAVIDNMEAPFSVLCVATLATKRSASHPGLSIPWSSAGCWFGDWDLEPLITPHCCPRHGRVRRRKMGDVLPFILSDHPGRERSKAQACPDRGSHSDPALSGRLIQFVLLLIAAYLSCFALWAQTPDSQANEASQSWTATTESKDANSDALRTIESYTQNGTRTLDTQSVQRESDGHFEPYQDIEKETVQVDASTVRTTTRTFDRNADGVKTLVQVIEEEKRTLAGGDSNLVSATSSPDSSGNLQVVRRQIEETKKISRDVEETKTTVMLPNVNGGLAPAVKVEQRREQGANDTVETQKVTLLPDGAGTWQVGEIRQATTRQEGENRSTEE